MINKYSSAILIIFYFKLNSYLDKKNTHAKERMKMIRDNDYINGFDVERILGDLPIDIIKENNEAISYLSDSYQRIVLAYTKKARGFGVKSLDTEVKIKKVIDEVTRFDQKNIDVNVEEFDKRLELAQNWVKEYGSDYQVNLLKRKEDVIRLIDEKGLLTEELQNQILVSYRRKDPQVVSYKEKSTWVAVQFEKK